MLHVTADEKWLKDPKRVYPVSIDPSTSVSVSSDTFVMSAYPTTNYSAASQKWDAGLKAYVLKTGYYDGTTGTNYAFMKFDNLKPIKNMTVTKATLKAYTAHSYYGSKATGLWLDTVNSNYDNAKITWKNKPGSKTSAKPRSIKANGQASMSPPQSSRGTAAAPITALSFTQTETERVLEEADVISKLC